MRELNIINNKTYMKRITIILVNLMLLTSMISAQRILSSDDKFMEQALKKIINDAKNGNAESQFTIGKHCLLGELLKQDSIKGLEYLNLSANQGYSPAYQELGVYWLEHNQIELAESYLKKALEQFDDSNKYLDKESITTRLFNIAAYDIIGDEELSFSNIIKNMNDKALSRYEFLANYDDDALMLIMEYYGVKKDYSKALFYGTKCYEKGIPSSGFWLGQIYEYGLGVPEDFDKAIIFYELGANSTDDDVNQICRSRLSEICYKSNIMDKAFKYSFDYAHNEVDNDSGTADVLHNLATCYRFGRGVKQNVDLANIWDALGIWYCEFDRKEETIAEFEGFDPDDDTQLINYILKLLFKNNSIKRVKSSSTTLTCGVYYLMVEHNWNKAEPYLVKSYNMEDALPEGQAISAWLINSIYESFPLLKKEDGNKVIKDFIDNAGINIADLDKEHVMDNCFYKIFVEQIKEIEQDSLIQN